MKKQRQKIIKLAVLVAALLNSSILHATDNTVVGDGAAPNVSNNNAQGNTVVGVNSGAALTDEDYNTFLGKDSGLINTTNDNVFIGHSSGSSNTTGTDNTFVGTRAGAVNTSTDNTFVGTNAGLNNTTGSDNTFIGEESGKRITTGDSNTFIGQESGRWSTTGEQNTFVGTSASGRSTLVGHNNTAIGETAGYYLSDGSRNTMIGVAAGQDIDSGLANTMVGADAGSNTNDADFNTFIGFYAGWDNNRINSAINANRNTAVGAVAGTVNREGEDNVWLGAFSNSSYYLFTYNSGIETEVKDIENGTYFSVSDPSGSTDVSRTTVLGAFAAANNDDSVSLGYGAVSDKTFSLAIGSYSSAKGQSDIVIGANTSSTHKEAIAIGYEAITHDDYTVTLGNQNTLRWDPSSDGVTTLGMKKYCYQDANINWVCEDQQYRFTDVISQKLSSVGAENTSAQIDLWADDGDDYDDRWDIAAANAGDFSIATYKNSSNSSGTESLLRTELFSLDNSGNATLAGNLAVNSDKRLKKDIEPIKNALALVSKIKGVTYYWKPELNRETKKQYGVIAQNVEAVIPELVSTGKDDIKSVNYQALVPVLINAISEQQAQIDKYQMQIDLRQKELTQLMMLISAN